MTIGSMPFRYAQPMRLAIVGAGYVGLVTAACLAHVGHDIVCLDVDAARIERLRHGDLPVHEPGLDDLVADGLANGRLRFAVEYPEIRDADMVVICVGTLDAEEEWNGDIVRAAVRSIASDPTLPRSIVIRSTLLPGTAVGIAREVRAVDPNVRLAHNPEFTREAVAVKDFLAPDRVVVGVDGHDDGAAGTALADALRVVYAPLDAPVVVTDLTSAETIKVASNVFLAAKITFANEISRLTAATGADAAAVVDGMGLDKRIVRSFLSPGPGFGGSCFPSQARALPRVAASLGVQTPLMDAIWQSNVSQTDWLLDGLERASGRPIAGMRVALLGLTFKAGTDDLRESPAIRLGGALLERGASVAAFDPVSLETGVALLIAGGADVPVEASRSAADACAGADAVVVATEWPDFAALDWAVIAPTMVGRVIVDGRSVVDAEAASAAGLRVIALGVEVSGAAIRPVG
jgi:UDPglucose 6-dehydrogenase